MRVEETLEQLLGELPSITEEDALLMAQLWADEDQAARQRAWQRAKATIERKGLTKALDNARKEVTGWMQATSSDYQGISGLLGREGDHMIVKRAAAPAVLDAVAALLAERDLFGEDYDVLSRPWRIALERERVVDS